MLLIKEDLCGDVFSWQGANLTDSIIFVRELAWFRSLVGRSAGR